MKLASAFQKYFVIAVMFFATLGISAAVVHAAPASVVPATKTAPANYASWLNNQVRHNLLMVPWYGVFDQLGYSVRGTEVTLTGKVLNPAIKSEAVGAVKHIEGVTKVSDHIKLLPLSPMDARIRRAEYHSIFSYSDLYRYAMGANPSIHIIVENGHVTLVGYVDNGFDARMAYIRARSVPGVFSVTNRLQVAHNAS